MTSTLSQRPPVPGPVRDDIRAALAGIALAAHGSGSGDVLTILAGAASRLVGKQVADVTGFERLVECAAELHMAQFGLLPDDLEFGELSRTQAQEVATADAESNLSEALDDFGA